MVQVKKYFAFLFIATLALGCSADKDRDSANADIRFPDDNAGLTLPEGFKAVKVADSLGSARHIVVADNGTIYVALRRENDEGGVVALRDTDGDGKADQKEYFGDHRGTGIGLHGGYLYASSNSKVYRYKMNDNNDDPVPSATAEVIVQGFPEQSQHADKAFTFDNSGHIYVNVGAPSNSCQQEDRTSESPGQDPCPLLERHAGIWQFSASQPGQTQQNGNRYATGLRNVVGLDWNNTKDVLYVTQHGRDQLYQNWSKYYTEEESAELPSETLYKVNKGDNFGWPYTYYNHQKDSIMLAPEYGGNGDKTLAGTKYEGNFKQPVVAFPGHWAPNALEFYNADQFPAKYQNGAFIAFHGSWNRSPEPQEGYKVVFVPFESGSATGEYEEFATGFPGTDNPQPGSAEHRPTGLATGPDGSLYVTDDSGGTVWRIVYTGDKKQ